MFSFSVEKAEFGLKPMNCPGKAASWAACARQHAVAAGVMSAVLCMFGDWLEALQPFALGACFFIPP